MTPDLHSTRLVDVPLFASMNASHVLFNKEELVVFLVPPICPYSVHVLNTCFAAPTEPLFFKYHVLSLNEVLLGILVPH